MTIIPKLDAVFIHVTDMARSIDWYCRLLDLPHPETSHDDMICDLPIPGDTGILLDAYPKPTPPRGTGPRVMFNATNLDGALSLARTLSPSVSGPEDIGSAVVFYLEDPDANLICIKVPKA